MEGWLIAVTIIVVVIVALGVGALILAFTSKKTHETRQALEQRQQQLANGSGGLGGSGSERGKYIYVTTSEGYLYKSKVEDSVAQGFDILSLGTRVKDILPFETILSTTPLTRLSSTPSPSMSLSIQGSIQPLSAPPSTVPSALIIDGNTYRLYAVYGSLTPGNQTNNLVPLPLNLTVTSITYDPTFGGRFILTGLSPTSIYTYTNQVQSQSPLSDPTALFSHNLQGLLSAQLSDLSPITAPSITIPPQLHGIAVARTPPGFDTLYTSYLGISNSTLFSSIDLLNWLPSSNMINAAPSNPTLGRTMPSQPILTVNGGANNSRSINGSVERTGAVTDADTYFSVLGIAFDNSSTADLYYAIDPKSKSICKSTANLGIANSTGGALSCIETNSSLSTAEGVRLSLLL